MWPHQSSLREILRCVCYEKMEGSRASCAASRGAFGFLCSPRARKLPGTRGSGARRLPPLPKAALLRSHGRARLPGHPAAPTSCGEGAPRSAESRRFPEVTRARPARGARTIPAPASPGCPQLSATLSLACENLCQTPRKELIFSAAVCLERIKRL